MQEQKEQNHPLLKHACHLPYRRRTKTEQNKTEQNKTEQNKTKQEQCLPTMQNNHATEAMGIMGYQGRDRRKEPRKGPNTMLCAVKHSKKQNSQPTHAM
jgi:hypothetical protein